VLLPGDPQRALAIAQALLEKPRMFNHHRGLWGYTGRAGDGELLTVQATGMGGPSAAIVLEELLALGARRFVRVGTCGALDPALELGRLVTVTGALAEDGASRALGAEGVVEPDRELTRALLEGPAGEPALAVTTDLFYERRSDVEQRWRSRGAAVVEMEAATVLTLCARRGTAAACALAVSDAFRSNGDRRRLSAERLEETGLALGAAGLAALAPR
jgi:uridine phosphorylase